MTPNRLTPGNATLLARIASERAMDLAQRRLLCGLRFFDGNYMIEGFARPDVKMALLLTLAMNPNEALTGPERALLDGRQRECSFVDDKKSAKGRKNSKPTKSGEILA